MYQVRIPCVACHGPLDITPDLIGQQLACPHCGHRLTVHYQGHQPVAVLEESPELPPGVEALTGVNTGGPLIESPAPVVRTTPALRSSRGARATGRGKKRAAGQHPAIGAVKSLANAWVIVTIIVAINIHLIMRHFFWEFDRQRDKQVQEQKEIMRESMREAEESTRRILRDAERVIDP